MTDTSTIKSLTEFARELYGRPNMTLQGLDVNGLTLAINFVKGQIPTMTYPKDTAQMPKSGEYIERPYMSPAIPKPEKFRLNISEKYGQECNVAIEIGRAHV